MSTLSMIFSLKTTQSLLNVLQTHTVSWETHQAGPHVICNKMRNLRGVQRKRLSNGKG